MIVVGYYGVGKSSASHEHYEIVDLEGKYFKRITDDWNLSEWIDNGEGLKRYIWLVKDLSNEGFVVCVPPNKEIRKAISNDKEISKKDVCYICPRQDEKDAWMKHLYARWQESQAPKDEMTFDRVRVNFEADIKDMIDDDVKIIWVSAGQIEKDGLFSVLKKEDMIR